MATYTVVFEFTNNVAVQAQIINVISQGCSKWNPKPIQQVANNGGKASGVLVSTQPGNPASGSFQIAYSGGRGLFQAYFVFSLTESIFTVEPSTSQFYKVNYKIIGFEGNTMTCTMETVTAPGCPACT
ncbi:hypothetical protein EMCRGX_G018811 [Ephydatia muelleri]|eukprot:Em0011g1154a